jgi:hypothetical protein
VGPSLVYSPTQTPEGGWTTAFRFGNVSGCFGSDVRSSCPIARPRRLALLLPQPGDLPRPHRADASESHPPPPRRRLLPVRLPVGHPPTVGAVSSRVSRGLPPRAAVRGASVQLQMWRGQLQIKPAVKEKAILLILLLLPPCAGHADNGRTTPTWMHDVVRPNTGGSTTNAGQSGLGSTGLGNLDARQRRVGRRLRSRGRAGSCRPLGAVVLPP